MRPIPGMYSILLGVLLLTSSPLAAQSKRQPRGKPRASEINKAYEKIKEKRSEYVDEYTATLFELAASCVEKNARSQGEEILTTIEKLYQLPRNRRKIGSAGVIDDGTPLDPSQRQLKKVKQKELTPQEKKRRDAVLERVEELRDQLTGEFTTEQDVTDRKIATLMGRARKAFLKDMVSLAQLCVKQNFPAHGYEVLLWVLPFDPDNEKLRNALRQGKYQPQGRKGPTEWYSPFELAKAKKGYLLHDDYGWVQPAELKALEKGLLYYNGKWLPREQVETLRQEWSNAWIHETAHFKIRTNAPLRDAVEFGREVERFYRFFFRVFVDYYTQANKPPDPMLVFGGGLDRGRNKLELHYYASRESYIKEATSDPELQNVPNLGLIEVSAGFYYPGNGKAYFYRTERGPDLSVIYHEVTHQIFGETTPGRGPRPPVWMVESFGVFMQDPVVRGDAGTERLLAGAEPPVGVRAKDIRDINDFVKNYQADGAFHGALRADNYATAGAVAHFFIFYKGGIYRKGYLRYAREAYRNSDIDSPTEVDKLYEYIDLTEEELQTEWEDFNRNPTLFDF